MRSMKAINDTDSVPHKKIKILHTIRQGQIGGGETHVLDLVQQLNPRLYESTVLCFTDGEMIERLRQLNISSKVIYTETPFDIRVFAKVIRFMRSGDFDIIHAHGTRACSNSMLAAIYLNIPVIYTVHGWSFHNNQSRLLRGIRQWIERRLVRNVSKTILVSKSNQKDGIDKLKLTNSEVIYNGVSLKRFHPLQKGSSLPKKSLNLPENKLIVGFIARLTIQKDPFTFIKAAKKVIEQGVNAHFLIVGDGELMTQCKELANLTGMQTHISFVGFRSDIPEILNLLDIYCLPSLWEGLPIGVLEAMASKTAVVATPVDGTVELIENNKTGMLSPVGKPDEMAKAIIQLATDEEYRERMVDNAYLLIQSEFTITKMSNEVERVYSKLLRTSGNNVDDVVPDPLKIAEG